MQFIELTGRILLQLADIDGLDPDELRRTGVTDDSVVRVNRQGDIELRRRDRWDVIGGLLGSFEKQLRAATHLDWA